MHVTPPVTLVCGPAGSGKTTYVQNHMQAGDLVLDFDTLVSALMGGQGNHRSAPEELLPFAWRARKSVLKELQKPSLLRHAWVITGLPVRVERDEFVDKFGASIVVLETDADVCLRRILKDVRRGEDTPWEGIVREWWRRYEPRVGDIVLKEHS